MILEIVVEVGFGFVIVRVSDFEVLTARAPKLRDAGLAEREFCVIPVPESVTETPELAVFTKLMAPGAAPAEMGAKVTE